MLREALQLRRLSGASVRDAGGATSAAPRSSTSCWCWSSLVPLFLGVLQVGLVLHVRNTLTAAASEGARYAATRRPGAGRRRGADPRPDPRRPGGPVRPRGDRTAYDGATACPASRSRCAPRCRRSASGARRAGAGQRPRRRGGACRSEAARARTAPRWSRSMWLALLLLVPLVYLLVAVFDVQRASFGVSAARPGRRACLLAGARRGSAAARAQRRRRWRCATRGSSPARCGCRCPAARAPATAWRRAAWSTVRLSPPGAAAAGAERARRRGAVVPGRGRPHASPTARSGRTGEPQRATSGVRQRC